MDCISVVDAHTVEDTLGAETPTTDARKKVVRHLTFSSTLLSHALKCRKRRVVNTSNFAVKRRKMNFRVETQNGMVLMHRRQT